MRKLSSRVTLLCKFPVHWCTLEHSNKLFLYKMPFIYFYFPVTLSFTNKKLSFLFESKNQKAANRQIHKTSSFVRSWLTNHQKKQSPFVPSQIKSRNFSSSLFIGFNAKNVHLVLESFQEETIINHQQNVSRLTFRLWYKKGGKWS